MTSTDDRLKVFFRTVGDAFGAVIDEATAGLNRWVRDAHAPVDDEVPVCRWCKKPWPCPDRHRAEEDLASIADRRRTDT